MKIGDSVIVKTIPDTDHWQEIEGKQGTIVAKDRYGNVHVRISGYPNPFILRPNQVEVVK